MHVCAHKVCRGSCGPPKTPRISPLTWHPRRLLIIPTYVAMCPVTLSMVPDAGGRRSLYPCVRFVNLVWTLVSVSFVLMTAFTYKPCCKSCKISLSTSHCKMSSSVTAISIYGDGNKDGVQGIDSVTVQYGIHDNNPIFTTISFPLWYLVLHAGGSLDFAKHTVIQQ